MVRLTSTQTFIQVRGETYERGPLGSVPQMINMLIKTRYILDSFSDNIENSCAG